MTTLAVAAVLAWSTTACQPGVGAIPTQSPSPSLSPVGGETTARPTSDPGPDGPDGPTGPAEPSPTSSVVTVDLDSCHDIEGFEVCGLIYERYLSLGGPDGVLGAPTSDEFPAADGRGRGGHFEVGDIYWSPSTGAWDLASGTVLEAWNALGGAGGALGFPVSIVQPQGDGDTAGFEHGSIAASPATGTHLVPAPADAAWQDTGGGDGPLGYPLFDQRPAVGADSVVFFQGGAVYVAGGEASVHEAPGGEVPAVDVPSAYALGLAEFVVLWNDRAVDAPGASGLVWTTDGCSGPTPPEVDVLFADPCLRHDFGYRNFLKGPAVDPTQQRRLAIDDQFHVDLRATCAAKGQPQITWFGVVVPCERGAQLMYDAVRTFGG